MPYTQEVNKMSWAARGSIPKKVHLLEGFNYFTKEGGFQRLIPEEKQEKRFSLKLFLVRLI